MPRYSKAILSVVGVAGYALDYGFPCRASAAAKGALGIRTFTGESNTVFGANRPKPPKAMYIPAKETSFLDDKTSANSTSVKLVKAGKLPVMSGGKMVAVKFHGMLWAWSLAPDVKTKISNVPGYSALGVEPLQTTSGASFAIFGASSVYVKSLNSTVRSPTRASRSEGGNRVSTFINTPFTGTMPEGWDTN